MATNNLKEFNNEWMLFGLLFFCLMTFTLSFMLNNNTDGLGTSEDKFNTYKSDTQSRLIGIKDTSNTLLNISAQTNPEISDLGSKDSVATSYGIFGNAKQFFTQFSLFLGWMFTGTTGKILITVFAGMFSFTVLYFIDKKIRTGT